MEAARRVNSCSSAEARISGITPSEKESEFSCSGNRVARQSFVPSPEPMHLTSPESPVVVDRCGSTLNSPTLSDIAASYYFCGDEEPDDISDGYSMDEDWLYQSGPGRRSLCGSVSDFTLVSREQSPSGSCLAQGLPVRSLAVLPSVCTLHTDPDRVNIG